MTEVAPYNPAELGEAMLSLTENQRRYVINLVEQGGRNSMLAYQRATGCSPENAHKNAWRMNSPHVAAAIREEADRRLRSGAILGASIMVEIAEDPMHKDRYKAAARLLDAAGLIVATEHKVTVEDKRSTQEIMRAIGRIAKDAGVDPEKLLGRAVPVDVEFEELSSEGLEDIL